MKKPIIVLTFFLILFTSAPLVADNNTNNPVYPTIAGVMGVTPASANSCAAIWIAIPEGQALTGVEWFNNDATYAFPGLYFESGIPENPVALDQTLLAAENVVGDSSAWSTVQFNEPVTCASEGLYIIFRYPAGVEVTGYGIGGGPAIGYAGEGTGAPGWLCSDGESWDKVGGEFGFAVLPILVNAESGMAQLNGAQGSVEIVETAVPVVTTLHSPFPNPFNPSTEINYSVAKAQDVELSVYDIRGRLVVHLAQGIHASGRYQVSWKGQDDNGRQLASGVYLVRFKTETMVMNQRLTLVK